MSEEEKKTIEKIERQITIGKCEKNIGIPVYISDLEIVLNLIEKKQKDIERIKEYAYQEVSHINEDIKDYIDDDRIGNKDIIGELKERKEHWKDIERIIEGKPNEELYMNWWRYGLYD